MKLLSFLFCLIIGVSQTIGALSPYQVVISNYTDKDYNAKFQNWDITQEDCGFIHIANSSGLLRFDGYFWELYPMPGNSVVRSCFFNNNRIYTGSFEEFGYFSPDNSGKLFYTSLSSSALYNMANQSICLQNEEIWKILEWKDKIVFQSFDNVFVYDPVSEKTMALSRNIGEDTNGIEEMRPLFCYVIDGELYSQGRNGGFFQYKNNFWVRLWPEKEMPSVVMGFVLPDKYSSVSNGLPDGTLLFTRDGNIFTIIEKRPLIINSSLYDYLKDTQINRVLDGGETGIFIGTIGKGVVQIDRKGNIKAQIDSSTGLNNNTVLGFFKDKNENVWVALDDGISLLHTGILERQLFPKTSNRSEGLGTIYDMGRRDGNLVVTTNQGAFINNKNGGFSLIPNSGGQNWFMECFDNDTFIGGNDLTIQINGKGEYRYLDFSGTDLKKMVIHGQEVLLQATYFSLELYRKNSFGDWVYSNSISNVEAPIKNIEIDSDGTIWATHWTKGFYKLQMTPDLTEVKTKHFYSSIVDEAPSHSVSMFKIRGKILFSEGEGVYEYSEEDDKFHISDKMGILNDLRGIRSVKAVDDNRYWIASDNSYDLVSYNGKEFKIDYSVPLNIYPRRNNGDNPKLFIDKDTIYFIANDIIGILPMDRSATPKKNIFPVRIREIGYQDPYGKFTSLDLEPLSIPRIPYENLTFSVSYPNYNKYPVKYRFRMTDGNREFDSISEKPFIQYQELSQGRHSFKCEVLDTNNAPISKVEYDVYVETPKALRWWALISYAVVLVFLIWIISRLMAKTKIKKQQHEFEKAEMERTYRIKEQELLIAHQEKLLLESQLSEKSKELASIAMGEYGRQLALENMKASFNDIRKKGGDITAAERVMKEFTISQGDARKFWDVFEKNFDMIHQYYFKNLRNKYPTLTPSDLKFCALLRMNMNTKEISRFTNLSVRGVETARYRLRKKFGLAQNQSLAQFLIDFSAEN